jgi:diadenosine tetraphosphate (Ap4A) HIT family hydrolase
MPAAATLAVAAIGAAGAAVISAAAGEAAAIGDVDFPMTLPCPLCHKLSLLRELPADELVWQFPHSVALLGPWQYHTGYCVLVSRSHATELHQLPTQERSAFLQEMVTLAHAIESAFMPRKMNYEALGNQVPHLHWHLFPRRQDDPEALQAVWLAFARAERDDNEKLRLQTSAIPRSEIADRLRDTLLQHHAPTL